VVIKTKRRSQVRSAPMLHRVASWINRVRINSSTSVAHMQQINQCQILSKLAKRIESSQAVKGISAVT
jgi:hypothetical protein